MGERLCTLCTFFPVQMTDNRLLVPNVNKLNMTKHLSMFHLSCLNMRNSVITQFILSRNTFSG